jgi:putative SOS response-associated peptidase YedK
MCARFTLFTPGDLIAERFHLSQVPSLPPRYNIAPSQPIPAIGARAGGHGRGLALFKWGFVPHWAQDDSGPKPVNARAETVAASPMFGEALRKRRCLIPADGFYEWRTVKRKKFPIRFRLRDGRPFAFAGLWDVWAGPGGKTFTCCILTTLPNDLTRPVHDRMPVILPREAEDLWLAPGVDDPDRLRPLLAPYPAAEMAADPANPALNKSTFEGPDCLVPPDGAPG